MWPLLITLGGMLPTWVALRWRGLAWTDVIAPTWVTLGGMLPTWVALWWPWPRVD
jgi:hypothetical protein